MAFSFFNKENRAEEYFNKGSHFEGLKSRSEAVYWYTKAAEMGNAKAQFALGNCYSQKGVAIEDKDKAFEWYTKAAEQGHAGAQFALGNCYWDGKGVYTDKKIAIEWYTKAGEQGHAEAQFTLGLLYAKEGEGVEKDLKTAVEWLTKTAEQGYAEAQHVLGRCYAEGRGVMKSWKKAAAWLMKAAEHGHAGAQNNLGECYVCGKGVEKDWKKATTWFMKAAEQGNESGMCNLGFCYYEGDGVIKDVEKAKKIWDTIDESFCYKMAVYFGEGAYLERNYPKADRILDLALLFSVAYDIETNQKVLPYLLKGKISAKFEKYESALAYLDKAIKNDAAPNKKISTYEFLMRDYYSRNVGLTFPPDMTADLREKTDMSYLIEALREKANILRNLKEIKEARETLKAALESAITDNQSALIKEIENELKVLPPDEDTLNNVTYLSAETLIQGDVGVYAKDDAIVNRPVVGEKSPDDPKNIYCPDCGKKLPVDARFCMGCGKRL